MNPRRTVLARAMQALAALLLGAAAAPAPAADAAAWPSRPVTLIVPFPAGGSSDAVARLVAQRLGEKLGQSVVVDNRPGAAGNLGTDIVAKAPPDGYMLAMSTSGPLANNAFLYRNMPFDPRRDLTPVAAVGEIPLIIAANPKVKADDLKQFVALSIAQPGKLTVGHPGNGTIGHLAIELLKSRAKADLLPVPYKGDAPAIADALGGTTDAISIPLTSLVSNVKAGKLKALAVTSRERFADLPQVPTAIEQGIDVEASVWFAVVGPKGLPAPVVERVNREVNAILQTQEARAKLAQFGAVPLGGSAAQLSELMATDAAKWKKIIDAAHITLE